MVNLGTRNTLEDLVRSYQFSSMRDDIQMKALDCVDFLAFLWQVDSGAFHITAFSNKAKITERGRKVLVTMTLSEPNNFQLKAQKKPYNEILAGMDRKKKGGLRTAKFATNNNNCLNLKKDNKYKKRYYFIRFHCPPYALFILEIYP